MVFGWDLDTRPIKAYIVAFTGSAKGRQIFFRSPQHHTRPMNSIKSWHLRIYAVICDLDSIWNPNSFRIGNRLSIRPSNMNTIYMNHLNSNLAWLTHKWWFLEDYQPVVSSLNLLLSNPCNDTWLGLSWGLEHCMLPNRYRPLPKLEAQLHWLVLLSWRPPACRCLFEPSLKHL